MLFITIWCLVCIAGIAHTVMTARQDARKGREAQARKAEAKAEAQRHAEIMEFLDDTYDWTRTGAPW